MFLAHIKQKCDTVAYVLTLMPRNVFSRRFSLANGRTSHIMTLLSMEFDKRWFPSGLSARPATRKAGYAKARKGAVSCQCAPSTQLDKRQLHGTSHFLGLPLNESQTNSGLRRN